MAGKGLHDEALYLLALALSFYLEIEAIEWIKFVLFWTFPKLGVTTVRWTDRFNDWQNTRVKRQGAWPRSALCRSKKREKKREKNLENSSLSIFRVCNFRSSVIFLLVHVTLFGNELARKESGGNALWQTNKRGERSIDLWLATRGIHAPNSTAYIRLKGGSAKVNCFRNGIYSFLSEGNDRKKTPKNIIE